MEKIKSLFKNILINIITREFVLIQIFRLYIHIKPDDTHSLDEFYVFMARENYIRIIKYFIKKEINFNYNDNTGSTALMAACENNHIIIVKLLVNAGADLNKKDDNDETALHLSSANGHNRILEILINNGADMSILDATGDNFIDVYSTNKGMKTNRSWIKTYDIQKLILSKCPSLYNSFVKNKIKLDPEIKKEFNHVPTMCDLNLL